MKNNQYRTHINIYTYEKAGKSRFKPHVVILTTFYRLISRGYGLEGYLFRINFLNSKSVKWCCYLANMASKANQQHLIQSFILNCHSNLLLCNEKAISCVIPWYELPLSLGKEAATITHMLILLKQNATGYCTYYISKPVLRTTKIPK